MRRPFLRRIARQWAVPLIGSVAAVASSPGPAAARTAGSPAQGWPQSSAFLFGASVYPEVQSPDEIRRMLDILARAGMNTVRVGESAWGNLEPRKGRYDFRWLRTFLDEVDRRGMKAVLGTNSYIAPQWLLAEHPDIRAELVGGQPLNPLLRKAASIHHPIYRAAAARFTRALATAFGNHPAVIGWQLDNEIDALMLAARRCTAGVRDRCGQIDRSAAAQRAFSLWLARTYRSPQELNDRWGLRTWGLSVAALDDVKLPTEGYEGGAPILDLAYRRFQRDEVAAFFGELAAAIRGAGAKQWITSNFMAGSRAASDRKVGATLSVAGFNAYAFSTFGTSDWSDLAREFDTARSATRTGSFIVTETQAGRLGGSELWDAMDSSAQARMALLLPVAYGATGSLYWSGNRLAAGHWPHWGALLDLNGDAEADFERVEDAGAFFRKWGGVLVAHPVAAKAAIVTDYDQVAAHDAYRHTPNNAAEANTTHFFAAFHRLGTGVDAVSPHVAAQPAQLARYDVVVLSSPTVLDEPGIEAGLADYVRRGGTVIVAPLTASQTVDGVFRTDRTRGLAPLTGATVRSERFVPMVKGGRSVTATLGGTTLAADGDGFFEILSATTGAEIDVVARFALAGSVLDGKPAIVRRRIGRGHVYKLGFWPAPATFPALIEALRPIDNGFFPDAVDADVHAVPRSDGSMFLFNTAGTERRVALLRSRRDRLTGKALARGDVTLPGYGIVWLE